MDKRKLSTVITVVAAFFAIALAVWGGFIFCTQMKIADAQLYALIPIYLIAVVVFALIDELVHEGAHFLVGAICGMGVKPPKIRLFKSSSVEMYPKGVKAMRLRFILTAAAGLFFDLLIIVLGLIALLVPSVSPIFALGLPYAFYSFVINVAPLEYGAGKTDGLLVCEAIANTQSAQVMFAVLKVQGKVNSGTMLKEIDESMLLDVPQIQEDDINFIMLTQLRFEYYEAKGNDSEAYKYFMRYKDLIRYLPSEYRNKENSETFSAEEIAEAQVTAEQLVQAEQGEGQAQETPAETAETTETKSAEAAEEPAAVEQPEDKKRKKKKKSKTKDKNEE